MTLIRDLGLDNSNSGQSIRGELLDWSIITLLDVLCLECDFLSLLISKDVDSDFPGDFKIFCPNCFSVRDFSELEMQQQNLLTDRFSLIKDQGLSETILRLENIFSILFNSIKLNPNNGKYNTFSSNSKNESENASPFKPPKLELKNENEVSVLRKGEDDAPIPPGYRSVAWLRVHEAQAVKHCFKIKESHEVFDNDGNLVFQCNYYLNESYEVRKFKSNVQAIRINGQNRRVIGWIRLEEANAIIESSNKRADVEFFHVRAGHGGLVQFFPEHNEIAKKYRSTTRLLRKE